MGRRVAVVFSEKDQIVDVKAVRKYLTGEESLRWERDGLEVLWYPGLDHATVGDTYDGSAGVLDLSTELETRSSTTLLLAV